MLALRKTINCFVKNFNTVFPILLLQARNISNYFVEEIKTVIKSNLKQNYYCITSSVKD